MRHVSIPAKHWAATCTPLRVIDGATIKRVLQYRFARPLPPETAYQQILHLVCRRLITRRTSWFLTVRAIIEAKVYGYSPVEQIIMTVNNIALKRQIHALEYYTAGSVPDALSVCWKAGRLDDIQRFQEYWDLLLSETAERRKCVSCRELARNFKETKQPPLKDVYDANGWRVVCLRLVSNLRRLSHR